MSRRMRYRWLSSLRQSDGQGAPRLTAGLLPVHRPLRFEPLEDRRLLSITVNTLVDEADGSIIDGDISLRDAIAAAAPAETIDLSVSSTINLTGLGQLVIDKSLTINGPATPSRQP